MILSSLPLLLVLTISRTAGRVRQRSDPVAECLMKRTFYHRQSGECHVPLDQGPCRTGELLLPDVNTGMVFCSPVSLREYCTAILLSDGSVGCEEDLNRDLYSRGQCGEGEILLPDNFIVDTRPCARDFSCRKSRTSRQYKWALKRFQEKGYFHKGEEQYLKDLVCDFKGQSICLPDNNRDSLFTVENLMDSLVMPSTRCQTNPCPAGKTPWLSEDGHYRCLVASPSLNNCPLDSRHDNNGRLQCRFVTLKSVAPWSRSCRRRSVWSRHRMMCVMIFGYP